MLDTNELTTILTDSLSQALETMAFMVAMPMEDELPEPENSLQATMQFQGPQSGRLEMTAPVEWVEMFAANVMGIEPDDPDTEEKSVDAFKELLNTICGVLLPRLAEDPADIFNVTIPQSQAFTTLEQWQQYVAQDDVNILEVDFHPVAIRMIME
ncbi:MAG: chemotaxis protein CheX [Phycisphaerae bacterium]|nr:chemotaxis protein CheX [Phycisphaerae bacterium]